MKTLNKSILLYLCLGFALGTQAQNRDLSLTLSLGIGTPLLDNGPSFHLGLNPTYKLAPIFSLEGQISYIRTQINGSFLSGRTGNSNTLNLLAGGRLYLLSEGRNVRPYLNLLVGTVYEQEQLDGTESSQWGFGYSAGAYVEFNSLVVGLSLDAPQYLLLKVGYRL
ncbi:MAG: outer membrane beta-barrel protein [Bacteroidota bacterium]